MPAARKPATRPGSTEAKHSEATEDARRLDQIAQSLEAAQKDLTAIGGSVGVGVRDLKRDVNRLLRNAQRDLAKMSKAVQRDLNKLQKDLASTTAKPAARGTAKPAARGAAKTAARPATPRARKQAPASEG